jgi:hypothetical protein
MCIRICAFNLTRTFALLSRPMSCCRNRGVAAPRPARSGAVETQHGGGDATSVGQLSPALHLLGAAPPNRPSIVKREISPEELKKTIYDGVTDAKVLAI